MRARSGQYELKKYIAVILIYQQHVGRWSTHLLFFKDKTSRISSEILHLQILGVS